MSDIKHTDIITEAIEIIVEWENSEWRAKANKLPPGAPIGSHCISQEKAKLDLLAKIMCGTYRHKVNKLIDEKLNRNKKSTSFHWSFEFPSETTCKIIVTDRNGKEDSRTMNLAPEKKE